jgi:hypothetical protein
MQKNKNKLYNNKALAIVAIIVLALTQRIYAQNFPKLGNDTLLDIATWNVEWLGSTTNGPTDETVQYNNVLALMNKTELDVLALQEVSNPSTFNSLGLALTNK